MTTPGHGYPRYGNDQQHNGSSPGNEYAPHGNYPAPAAGATPQWPTGPDRVTPTTGNPCPTEAAYPDPNTPAVPRYSGPATHQGPPAAGQPVQGNPWNYPTSQQPYPTAGQWEVPTAANHNGTWGQQPYAAPAQWGGSIGQPPSGNSWQQPGYPPAQPQWTTTTQPPLPDHTPEAKPIARLWTANWVSLTASLAAIVYILLDLILDFGIIGIVPVIYSITAFRRREKLAPVGLVCAILAVVAGIALR
ncbi:hypothetical protein OG921_26150 [Aldersonia sp. NBC_00410]|uniref:hypothetical protein n=1 Tax=Aldersonia sp. NBC_00410 TaxID=2975954 RepID=UPI00225A70DB|nr:hypothetical protein [Aldersonia sp. NBC_00410]MCX5046661.1 hypothetical protein [Aldersonia sp. NBC_00410]